MAAHIPNASSYSMSDLVRNLLKILVVSYSKTCNAVSTDPVLHSTASPAARSAQGRPPTPSLWGLPVAHVVRSPWSSGVRVSVKTPAVHSALVSWPLEGGHHVLDGPCGNYTCFICKIITYQGVSYPLVPALPFTLVELLTAQSVSSGVVVSYPGQLMTYTFSVSSVPDLARANLTPWVDHWSQGHLSTASGAFDLQSFSKLSGWVTLGISPSGSFRKAIQCRCHASRYIPGAMPAGKWARLDEE